SRRQAQVQASGDVVLLRLVSVHRALGDVRLDVTNKLRLIHGRTTASASLARVRLTMSLSVPSGRRSRYIPGQRSSGTMRGSKTGFLDESRPVFSPSQGLGISAEISACPTVDSTWGPGAIFIAFSAPLCPTVVERRGARLRRASCAAKRQVSEQ